MTMNCRDSTLYVIFYNAMSICFDDNAVILCRERERRSVGRQSGIRDAIINIVNIYIMYLIKFGIVELIQIEP